MEEAKWRHKSIWRHGRRIQNCISDCWFLTGHVGFGEPLGAAEVVQLRVHILIQQQSGLSLFSQR